MKNFSITEKSGFQKGSRKTNLQGQEGGGGGIAKKGGLGQFADLREGLGKKEGEF